MLKTIAIAACTLAVSTAAQAATLTINPILGEWQNVVATVPANLSISGNGSANPKVRWGQPASTSGQSGYDFDAAAVPLNVAFVPNGATTGFALGNFTHLNRPIFDSISSAQLKLTYGVFLDAGFIGNFATLIDFAHDETVNGADPCAYGGANGQGVNINGCADSVVASLNLGASQSFTVSGVQYVLNVTGFTVGGNPATQFLTIEDAENLAVLNGAISAKRLLPGVPEPASWALMIFGFGLVGGAIRQRSTPSVSYA